MLLGPSEATGAIVITHVMVAVGNAYAAMPQWLDDDFGELFVSWHVRILAGRSSQSSCCVPQLVHRPLRIKGILHLRQNLISSASYGQDHGIITLLSITLDHGSYLQNPDEQGDITISETHYTIHLL